VLNICVLLLTVIVTIIKHVYNWGFGVRRHGCCYYSDNYYYSASSFTHRDPKPQYPFQHQDFPHKKKTENSYSEFNTLLFETDVNTTTYFTNNSISTWIKESNDRHQIVGFLRFNSSVNSLEPHVTSIIKPLGVHS
jgi:hypothetical protein